MSLESIKYSNGTLEILDQLLLPVQSKYVAVKGVEDGWKVINKMQVCVNGNVLHRIFNPQQSPHATKETKNFFSKSISENHFIISSPKKSSG